MRPLIWRYHHLVRSPIWKDQSLEWSSWHPFILNWRAMRGRLSVYIDQVFLNTSWEVSRQLPCLSCPMIIVNSYVFLFFLPSCTFPSVLNISQLFLFFLCFYDASFATNINIRTLKVNIKISQVLPQLFCAKLKMVRSWNNATNYKPLQIRKCHKFQSATNVSVYYYFCPTFLFLLSYFYPWCPPPPNLFT